MRVTGQTVTALTRRAKYLVAELSSGEVLLMHLGMSGSFRVERTGGERLPGEFYHPRGVPGLHDHVVFRMSTGAVVTYNDPRRFGFMKLIGPGMLERDPLLAGLGPEPLGNAFDAAMLASACAGKKTTLKAALLDQRVVAGLGNIYVCEALHRAGVSPKRAASTLALRNGAPHARAIVLTDAIRAVLSEAIAAGGSSLRDHRQTSGELGYFQHTFRVYDRAGEKCTRTRCGGTVRRIVQNGRSTFWCQACQK
jgi:formamidopyrimidine-DNA glycosylase